MRIFTCHTKVFVAAFCLIAGAVQAADPSAPARDNIPRIWRALSGDKVELDGDTYRLHGVTCPAPDTDKGRQAKALLNTFMRGSKNNRHMTCTIFLTGTGAVADCTRKRQTASKLMINSRLCEARSHTEMRTNSGKTLSLARYQPAFTQVSIWRLRSCLGVHPGNVSLQCRLASRMWPLRYAEAARWLERQTFSRCPAGFRPARSVALSKAAHAPPNRYSLRPLLHSRCQNGFSGH